jgi:quercetin dioxygenase-like cupin family protein
MKRVVTGWDENGNATILFEGKPPMNPDFGFATASEIWITESTPADTNRSEDPTAREWQVEPPPGGSVFRTATYPPGAEVGMHATETLDYIVVIAGQLTLLYGDREIALGPGDTLVQQATPHGWANRSDEPCVVAAVLLDAKS